ncbi:MAG: tRNA 2-thiouridine(34) synthase MnmA [Clostridium sp.]|nr:tRNA 2-thiouridine(34) synthase MnmA [Acetatifactor muris]MCM1526071.1 tRNA 2-thiouridine(34) synthase MnmA [Bacteroides sp.]MCM1562169.1 tRNA 2-thiouridine(34) synthase MnmA [Clostridium sp.]
MGQKVVTGLSGGVDSSVAAFLLKKAGYDVIGVHMRMWQERPDRERTRGVGPGESDRERIGQAGPGESDRTGGMCGSPSAAEDAERVAKALGIPFHVLDFSEEFKRHVTDYFTAEYLRGRTPNPCIACNRHVKWEALLRAGQELGADYLATGHYARVDRLSNGRMALRNSATAGKDQTYALYDLTQEQLSHTLFPVGAYTKGEIRNMAQEAGIPVADKADSQEICFVPDGDYAGFILRETGRACEPGNFVTSDGEVLGRHEGIIRYTVGQRRGLNLPMGKRMFVTAIRPETNEVVVGDNADTFTDEVRCDRLNFMAIESLNGPMRVLAKIRYNHPGEFGVIEPLSDGSVICRFERPVRAATPGQAMVFYEGEYVLGGGVIL